MPEGNADSSHPSRPRVPVRLLAGPLAVWAALQLVVLLLAFLQVPLSDGQPRPAERITLEQMLIVQIAAASALFPWLLRRAMTSLALIASAIPFALLAGFFAAREVTEMPGGIAFTVIWLAALAAWAAALSRWGWRPRHQMWSAALATALALGGPLLWYVQVEFLAHGGAKWETHGMWGPVMGCLAILNSEQTLVRVWIGPILLFCLGFLLRVLPQPAKTH